MKKNVLLSLLLVAVLLIGAGLGTYAWFSSQVTSAITTFETGTLKLNLNKDKNNALCELPVISNIKPGEDGIKGEVIIENTGSIDLIWFGNFETLWDVNLAEALYIKDAKMEFLSPDDKDNWLEDDHFIQNGVPSGVGETWMKDNLVDDSGYITLHTWMNNNTGMYAGNGIQAGALRQGYKYKFSFELAMLESAEDEYQGKTMGLKYVVNATQINKNAIDWLKNKYQRITWTGSTSDVQWYQNLINNNQNK